MNVPQQTVYQYILFYIDKKYTRNNDPRCKMRVANAGGGAVVFTNGRAEQMHSVPGRLSQPTLHLRRPRSWSSPVSSAIRQNTKPAAVLQLRSTSSDGWLKLRGRDESTRNRTSTNVRLRWMSSAAQERS